MPRQPIYGEESGTCTTCGRGFPVSYLVLTRRYGWQCLPGTGSQGCYDGPVQRDELRYIPRPYEGVRRSIAPVYDLATMGVDASQRVDLETRFRDHRSGVVWDITADSIAISPDQTSDSHGGWIYESDLRLWVFSGSMYLGRPWPDVYKFIPAPIYETYEFEVQELVPI